VALRIGDVKASMPAKDVEVLQVIDPQGVLLAVV